MIATGETVGLADWITDDTCLGLKIPVLPGKINILYMTAHKDRTKQ